MKLEQLNPNMCAVVFKSGTEVLFSYQTPVAAFIPGQGFVRTSKHYSATTTRHINNYLRQRGGSAKEIDQEQINELVDIRELKHKNYI